MNYELGNPQDMNDPSRYAGQDFFVYEIGLPSGATLVPGASTTLTFNVDGESDFFWSQGAVSALSGSDGTTWEAALKPSVYVTITDTTTQRPVMNSPVPVGSIFGDGQLPFVLPLRKLFFSKATVKITLQNYSDNQTFSQFDLSFIGVKAYLK